MAPPQLKTAKETEEDVIAGNWTKDYYRSHGQSIKLDTRWKTELSEDDLLYFEKYAGDVNATIKFEY